MIRVISRLFMAVVVAMAFTSCNEVVEFKEVGKTVGVESDVVQVLFSVDKFEDGNGGRTTMDPANNYLPIWAEDDVIGIFPREGYQEPFEIPVDQVGKATAQFDGGYWALKSGLEYNAYYPFDKANFESAEMKEQIPVSYLGQSQNGTTCGAGAYDYTYSDWTIASGGTVSFSFHHLGAIVIFNVKYPATTTYTKLTLTASSSVIPTTGSYDLTAQAVSFVSSTTSDRIDLSLTNCSGTTGEMGTFYMMLPPMDLSGKEVTLTLTTQAGTTCVYDIDSPMIVKGKKYEFTGTPKSSTVNGTIDGWEGETPAQGSGLTITWSSDATDAQKRVLTNLVNNMVLVEGGTFMMGSDDEDAYGDEQPVHSVTLTNDYYMGKFEVTHEEWIAVMYSDPGDDLPVKGVSWDDIVNYFLPELNRLTGLTFRLPTEAEWEFAARGGNNSMGYEYSGSNTIDDVAWYYNNSDPDGDGSHSTHAVGTKLPNELGLYDMTGNVCEWCSDWYNSGYYSTSPTTNPTGPATGSVRVLRGGGWYVNADDCRVSDRYGNYPDSRGNDYGFRLAL